MKALTEKQKKALKLLNDKDKIFYLFDGSSRSGKTWILCAWLIAYSYRYKGINILIARYHFNNAKATIWNQTLIPMLKAYFKGTYDINKTDYIITFNWGSTITLGGLDEGDRLDKILGSEYAIIYVNEATENAYSTYQTLISRLNSILCPVKFVMDCNPRSPSHWLNRLFIQKINPETRKQLPQEQIDRQCRLFWHVIDNEQNLSKTYIELLSSLTGLKRKRFFDGVWSDATEGGVFRFNRENNCVEEPIKYQENAIVWTGIDFGISDNLFIVWVQIVPVPKTESNKTGVEIQIIDEYVNSDKDYKYYSQVIKSKPYKDVRHSGDPSGIARNASLQSWISLFASEGIHIRYKNGISVADYISNANFYMPAVKVCENQCPKMVEMLENWTYPKDKDGKIVEGKLPEHNEYSHPGSAFYYLIANIYPPVKNSINLPSA